MTSEVTETAVMGVYGQMGHRLFSEDEHLFHPAARTSQGVYAGSRKTVSFRRYLFRSPPLCPPRQQPQHFHFYLCRTVCHCIGLEDHR